MAIGLDGNAMVLAVLSAARERSNSRLLQNFVMGMINPFTLVQYSGRNTIESWKYT